MSRILPALTLLTRPFWQSGADSILRVQRCSSCKHLQHPPRPCCTRCLSTELEWSGVSGFARVESFTVNHQPWRPDLKEPYTIAVVSLEEQTDVRLTTRIIGCAPEHVFIGQRVRVRFDRIDDIYLPLFEPMDINHAHE